MASLLLAACFSAPAQIESEACEEGSNGCPCFGNETCLGELVCNEDSNCVAEDCVDGTRLCPCYGNSTCDAGLVCDGGICRDEATGSTSPPPTSGPLSTTQPSLTGGDTETETSAETTSGPAPMTGGKTDLPPSGCPLCMPEDVCVEDSCVPNPYHPCGVARDCPEATDICHDTNGNGTPDACSPDCTTDGDCPLLGAFAVGCVDDHCVLRCDTAPLCPVDYECAPVTMFCTPSPV